MDPNATLDRINELEQELQECECKAEAFDLQDELLDTYRALVGWLQCGGFPPDWECDR